MSVVFHRSTGKMILKSLVAAIVLSFAWIKSVAGGTSYSNVYMQSGPGLTAFYGPAALRSAQLAPLAASPLMSSLIPPCVSPCVLPSQQVAALAPIATSSANFISYKSPIGVPVVVAPVNDEPTSYEYSYVVYDEDTGDQKAQKESSDGSVVRGQYSLIQPDGYIREVQYTADDIRGFNAVVKNFLPEEGAKVIQPCPEIKNEPLKESPKGESEEKANEAHDLEQEAPVEEQESHEGHDHAEGEGHGEHEEHEEPKNEEKEEHKEPKNEEPEKNAEPKNEEHETHEEPEKLEEQVKLEGHKENESHEEPAEHKEAESHEEPTEGQGEYKEPEGHEEHDEHSGQDEHASPEEHAEPEKQEESHAEEHGGEEKKEEEPRAALAEVQVGDLSPLVSYNDIIKCIQSAIKGVNTAQPSASPLTYIILNKPC